MLHVQLTPAQAADLPDSVFEIDVHSVFGDVPIGFSDSRIELRAIPEMGEGEVVSVLERFCMRHGTCVIATPEFTRACMACGAVAAGRFRTQRLSDLQGRSPQLCVVRRLCGRA